MLLIELDGEETALETELERMGNILFDLDALEVLVAQSSSERERLWASRRELSHSLKRQAKNKLAEDVVVPRTKMAELLSYCAQLSEQHGLLMPTYGHAGDGNLHVNFLWNDPDEKIHVDQERDDHTRADRQLDHAENEQWALRSIRKTRAYRAAAPDPE